MPVISSKFPFTCNWRWTQSELVEVITHVCFYAGWPRADSALSIAKDFFQTKQGDNVNTDPYKKIHAFTSTSSTGNPAACLYLEKGQMLSADDMLAVAKEHKGFVSEVVYCRPLGASRYRLHYYSSECEVEFCGHGTIACMYNLIRNNSELLGQPEIKIATNKGDLTVYNEIPTIDTVFITAPDKAEYPVHSDADAIAYHLGITRAKISEKLNIECIDAGLRTLIVPITDLATVLGMRPIEAELKDFCLKNDIDIILIFTLEVINKQNKVRTRVFAPPIRVSGRSGHRLRQLGFWSLYVEKRHVGWGSDFHRAKWRANGF